jgi:hypothetical protein
MLCVRAAKETTPLRCWVCRLPAELRSEIDDILRKRDFTKSLSVRTLREEGYTEARATGSTITSNRVIRQQARVVGPRRGIRTRSI